MKLTLTILNYSAAKTKRKTRKVSTNNFLPEFQQSRRYTAKKILEHIKFRWCPEVFYRGRSVKSENLCCLKSPVTPKNHYTPTINFEPNHKTPYHHLTYDTTVYFMVSNSLLYKTAKSHFRLSKIDFCNFGHKLIDKRF